MGSAMTTDAGIRDRATRWLIELDSAGTAQRAECIEWLRESPLHVREFLFVSSLWKGLDGVDSQQRMDVEALLAEASAKIVPLPAEKDSFSLDPGLRRDDGRGRYIKWIAGLAATIAIVAITGWWLSARTLAYSTLVGEQRSIKLSDGSLVSLNTQSRIQVRVTAQSRELTLLSGEALFSVARDPARPFRVHAGDAVIQALGTQFNVYRRAQGTAVSVVEGAVQVFDREASMTLGAGDQANIAPSAGIVKRTTPDIGKAVAWRERQLVFRGDPLEAVAAEVNRYNESLQIRVDGSARSRRLIGVFAADDPESLLQFLSRDESLTVDRNADIAVIRAR